MASSHPALSPGTQALLRLCPDAPHVEVEALELEALLGAALEQLRTRGVESVGEYLASLAPVDRLPAALAAVGQCLRVPVKVRGGACDAKGLGHPGNGMGALFGLLEGRSPGEPYTGRGAVKLLARARDAAKLIRAPVLRDESWVETRRDGSQVQRRRRFTRSLTYVPASQLRAYYRSEQLAPLVTELHRLCPRAWRVAASWRRCSRGYWGAIRRSRSDRVKADNAARRRAAFRRFKAQERGVRISKTEGENSPRARSRTTGSAASPSAAGAGRGGGWAERPVLDPRDARESTPEQGSFRDRLAAVGFDVAAWESQNVPTVPGVRPSFDDPRPERRRPVAPAVDRGGLPWRNARYAD